MLSNSHRNTAFTKRQGEQQPPRTRAGGCTFSYFTGREQVLKRTVNADASHRARPGKAVSFTVRLMWDVLQIIEGH